MAGVLVGGAFLSAVLQVVFDRMASREVLDFFQGRKLTGRLLDNLKGNLRSVAAVLEDAEEKQVTKQLVKEWLDDLKDAVYDAEDILDEIAAEVLRRKLDAESIASKVRNCISASIFASRIEGKMKEVLETLELLGKQKDLVGLLQNGVTENQSENFPTTSLVEESRIFGRLDEKKAIIDLLLTDPVDRRGSQKSVIALVGMGGIGKTTVAQLVYNDNRVNEFFNLKAWFCVSKEFLVAKVKKSILEVAAPSACGIEDADRLQVELKKNLAGKKFLVVLDDVWTEKSFHQEFLSELLQYGAQGSRILITTRSKSVASAMHAAEIGLKQLLNEDSWLLFTKHAFRDGSLDEHPALEERGRKIVEKCRGLPLAIKAVGDLLCSKLDDPKHWNKILESDWRDF